MGKEAQQDIVIYVSPKILYCRWRGMMASGMRLMGTNLVEVLESPEYKEVLEAFHIRKVRKKEILASPGSAEDNVFIIREGAVRVFLSSDAKEFALATLGAGDIYSTHTRAFCEALEDGSVFVCPVKEFRRIAVGYPEFTMTMVRVLGELLSSTFSIIHGFAFRNTELRLALHLYEQAQMAGQETPEGILVETGLTVEGLAQVVGASRQMVSTLLNGMYAEGLLKRVGIGRFLIPDLEALNKAAHPPL